LNNDATKRDPCRFCRIYALGLVAFAALIGAGTMLEFLLSVGDRYGARAFAGLVLVLNVVRSLAPAASGSALLLALVLWAHPLPPGQLQLDLRRILVRALVVSGPGYLVGVIVAVAGGFAVASSFGLPWATLQPGFGAVGPADFGVGLLATLVDAALIVFLAWRYLDRLQAARMSLPAKLIVVVTVTVGLRATVALILSSLLSF
jgi:hypothetical protein